MSFAARLVNEKGRAIPYDDNYIETFHNMVHRAIKDRGYEFRLAHYHPLMDPYPTTPVIVEVNDSAVFPHCVAFMGGKLYDPAEPHVCHVSRLNLDLLCGGPGKFVSPRHNFKWTRTFYAVNK